MNLLAWAVLGFGQIERYRDLIAALAGAQQDRGYSLMALLSKGGVTPSLATLLTAGLTLACAATCLVAGRAPRGPPGARGLFATCLVATPISWLHYFALLVVPVALARPRLSLLWLAPIALDAPAVGPDATQILIMFASTAAICLVSARPRREPAWSSLRRRPATIATAG